MDLAVKVAAGELDRRLDRVVWFTGELVQLTGGRRGQAYAVLRGSGARIDVYVPAVYARPTGRLETGTVVVVQGRLRIWQPGGRFQIAAASPLLPTASIGARANARAAGERQLRAAGVFDRPRRNLPRWPTTVAVVTSGRGAAIEDVRAAIRRRAPWVAVQLADCTVQGPGAGPSIIAAMDTADRSTADLIILTRGGGAPDTLDPFDSPDVVRRVAACRLPIIVAVGHEGDRTLAELAADHAASTPTAAAELAVPDGKAVRREVREHRRRLHAAARAICSAASVRAGHSRAVTYRESLQRLRLGRERLRRVDPATLTASLHRLLRSERKRLERVRDAVQRTATAVVREMRRGAAALRPEILVTHGEATIRADRHRANELRRAIHALSPERVLGRGYALVLDAKGMTVRDSSDARPGETLRIRLHDGEVAAVVAGLPIQPSNQGEEE